MSHEKPIKPLETLSPEEKEELNLRLLREQIEATKSGILQRKKKKAIPQAEESSGKKAS